MSLFPDLTCDAPQTVAAPPVGWRAVLSVNFPNGTVRHPRVLDRIHEELGRVCAVDRLDRGVRIGFVAKGSSRNEIQDDAIAVAHHVRAILTLPAAPAELILESRDPEEEPARISVPS